MKNTDYALEVEKLSKHFGSVIANHNISFKVPKGSIYGLIGENGAGKTTLMNSVYGYYRPTSGIIKVFGNEANITSPKEAILKKIGMVHQHFMLIDRLSVIDNIVIGLRSILNLPGRFNLEKIKGIVREKVDKVASEYGLNVDIDKLIEDLPVGEQQRVEIIKTLIRDAKLIILDEPTAVLTPHETSQLFNILDSLRKQNVTIIIISHKLQEIKDITDHVAVLKQGKLIETYETKNVSRSELAKKMIGRSPMKPITRKKISKAQTLLSIKNLSYVDTFKIKRIDNISFDIKEGSITGIAGVSGNGQTELLEILTGILPQTEGEIIISNNKIQKKAFSQACKFHDEGVAHIPEDRLKMGLIPEFDVKSNFVLGYQRYEPFQKGYILDDSKHTEITKEETKRYDVRPPEIYQLASQFSGGNQQKIVVAREMSKELAIVVAGQPSRGVDIGSIELIHSKLIEHRNNRKAVIFVSVEIDEILAISDRILVMFEGQIVDDIPIEKADRASIGMKMLNVKE